MKLFSNHVVIGCDRDPGIRQQAETLRSVLEGLAIRVHLYHFVHYRNVVKFLKGQIPDSDYTILCCHGVGDTEEEMRLNLEVIRQENDQDDLKYGWDEVTFYLTPGNIPEYIKKPKGTLICTAFGSGREPWVKAFLESGYEAYIAPVGPSVAATSSVLFLTSFFYHLMMHTQDYTDRVYTPREAVEVAAQADTHYEYGTRLFHYFEGQ
jgi:hypothetical protein